MRHPSLLDPPIAFAHRGASVLAEADTIDAFRLALRLGATGVETGVRLAATGEPVLLQDADVRVGLRRRKVSSLPRADLPDGVVSLAELYEAVGSDVHVSLDVHDRAEVAAAVAVAAAAGGAALERLHLCAESHDDLAAWRQAAGDARLVLVTRLRSLRGAPEQRAAALADDGIDGIKMPYGDWTGGLTTLFHRFDRLAYGWDAVHLRQIRELLDMGVDAVCSPHPDRLADALLER